MFGCCCLSAPVFRSLVYEVDSSIQVRLRDYTMSRVFATIDDEDDLDADDEGWLSNTDISRPF